MNYYVFDSSKSYSKYLQNRSLVTELKDEILGIKENINIQTRELIASDEQLSIKIAEDIAKAYDDSTNAVINSVKELEDSIVSTLNWGFTGIFLRLELISGILDDLKKIAKNASQVWAYEQYVIAREAFLNGWQMEALRAVDRAINGYGSNTGYELEPRFHFLKGLVLLGNKKNHDAKVINIDSAEKSFLISARYYKDFNSVSYAYFCASRSAYIQGKMNKALEYSKKSIVSNKNFLEAYFQIAKILCHIKNWDEAEPWLEKIFIKKIKYAIKAGADKDINQYQIQLNNLIENVRNHIYSKGEKQKNKIINFKKKAKIEFSKLKLLSVPNINGKLEYVNTFINKGDYVQNEKNLVNTEKAFRIYIEAENYLKNVILDYTKIVIDDNLKRKKREIEKESEEKLDNYKEYLNKRNNRIDCLSGWGGCLFIIIYFITFYLVAWYIVEYYGDQRISALQLGLIWFLPVLFFIFGKKFFLLFFGFLISKKAKMPNLIEKEKEKMLENISKEEKIFSLLEDEIKNIF